MDFPPCNKYNKIALSSPWQFDSPSDFLDARVNGPSLDPRDRLLTGPKFRKNSRSLPWPARPDHDGQQFSFSNSSTSATAETNFTLPSQFGTADPEVQSILKDHQVTGAKLAVLAMPRADSVPQLLDYLMTANTHSLPAPLRVGSPNESTTNSYSYRSKAHSSCSGSLYKTELCRSWCENSTCRYGNKCQFAHGYAELRPIKRHPKYKTEICRTFAKSGTCPYGIRCRFIHMTPPLPQPDPPAGLMRYPSNPQSLYPLPRQPLDHAFSVDSYLTSFGSDFLGNSMIGTGHIFNRDNLEYRGQHSPFDPFQPTMQPLHSQSLGQQDVLPAFTEEELCHSLGSCSINNDFFAARHNTGHPLNLGNHTGIHHTPDYSVPGGSYPRGTPESQRRLAIFQNITHGEN